MNKEDIDCQAQDVEQKLALDQDRVNRIHLKKNWKPKDKRKPKPSHNDKRESVLVSHFFYPPFPQAMLSLPKNDLNA